MTDADIEAVRQAFHAFASRDLDTLAGLLADNIAWHTPGENVLAGDLHGRDQVLAYLERVLRLSGDTMQVRPIDLLVGHDHVAALVEVTGERQGRTLTDRSIQLFRVESGRILERRLYPADQRAIDAFWSA